MQNIHSKIAAPVSTRSGEEQTTNASLADAGNNCGASGLSLPRRCPDMEGLTRSRGRGIEGCERILTCPIRDRPATDSVRLGLINSQRPSADAILSLTMESAARLGARENIAGFDGGAITGGPIKQTARLT